MNGQEWFTIPKAAELCGLHRVTMWKYARQGKIKAAQTPGGKFRIQKKDLRDFMAWMGIQDAATDTRRATRILVADDDPAVQGFLDRLLSSKGFLTAAAVDGFDTGIKMKTFKPDILILDLFMPDINGIEVCRRVKSDATTSHVIIIGITGHHSKKNEADFREAGADDYISKPLDISTLIESINTFFPQTRGQDQPTSA